MNLKESFCYQNFLESLLDTAVSYVTREKNYMKTSQIHLKKAAYPDAPDEEPIDLTKERLFPNYKPDQFIEFIEMLLNEKISLSNAINAAKATLDFDIDTVISINKKSQYIARNISSMNSAKEKEVIRRGVGYMINVEGNQTAYNYDIKEVSVPDFTKEKVRELAKSLIEKSDENSAKIDLAMVSTIVDYTPKYSVNDSFEDVLDSFCKA